MSFGIFTTNSDGKRIIDNSQPLDGSRIVPQLIKRIDLSQYPYQETYEDANFIQPGYIHRFWWGNDLGIQTNRQTIRFVTLAQGQDAWTSPDGLSMMFKAGSAFAAPIIYIFAIDYVTPSSDQIGIFLFNETTGALQYDSGNQHLSINQMMKISMDMSLPYNGADFPSANLTGVGSPKGGFPSPRAAFCLPGVQMWRMKRVKSDGEYEWYARSMFRQDGSSVQGRMMRDQFYYIETNFNNNLSRQYDSRSSNQPILCINTANYD